MFQLDDNFLNDVGLGGLPDDQKKAFLQHIYEELELRVGTVLSDGLTDAQMTEFETFMERDEAKVRAWLASNVPDYENSNDFRGMLANVPQGTPQVNVLSEYGSLKWLELNRPNYRQVVVDQIEKLKQEIADNKDQILAA